MQTLRFQPISGRVDGLSATKTVHSGSIPHRVEPRTRKIWVYSIRD